jgi:predicted GH43/DUF377 family glycosyl hydrolase
MLTVTRNDHNPLLSPKTDHEWEATAAFNWCPLETNTKEQHVLYRAQSTAKIQEGVRRVVSVIGTATSDDGIHYTNRRPLITPEHEWEKFGCEDPRSTRIGATHYVFYTALSTYPFGADGIRIALAKLNEKLEVIEKHPVTPFNAKAMALFPRKVNGKWAALLTINTDIPPTPAEICYVEFEKEEDIWSADFWHQWHANAQAHRLPLRRSDNDQIELGSAPLYTPEGWLVFYSHIQGYFHGQKTFGIEAVLLDLQNPQHIIGRTKGALMVPEEYYEHVGGVPNIIFPSGARLDGEHVELFYSAADTHSCTARLSLPALIATLKGTTTMFKRGAQNPIITPRPGVDFEARGTLNPAAFEAEGKIHILYRAVSSGNVSTIGYAVSTDGTTIDECLPEPIYVPRADFEKPGGCEDPRTTIVGDRIVMLYTAYDGVTPRVAATSISIQNFLARRWDTWDMPHLVTLASITNKDACVLPRTFDGKYMIIHRLDDMICADFIPSLEWKNEPVRSCIPLIAPRRGMWDGARIGLACPPLETKRGWLLFYHGVSNTTHYRVSVALLDKNNPTTVLARSALPIFEPVEEYEWKGAMPGVVFPCGVVCRKNTVFLYYGAADFVVGVATAKLSDILAVFD